MNTKIRVGMVGVHRSASFTSAFAHHPHSRIAAFCDIIFERAEEAAREYGAKAFTKYEDMLDSGEVDAVLVATPMQFHAPQAIAALNRNIHVLSEVTAAVSVEEARKLVDAANHSRAVYMMAENCNYMRQNALIENMVKAGVFGDVYFAEGEYLHELKQLNEDTPWRRKWQTGINGCTYPTHSLGPILQWLEPQRVESVMCVGSGNHYRDPRGDFYEQEDTVLMLCRLSKGGLAKIRIDMLSERPHATINYALQGTLGAYESARSSGDNNRVYIKKAEQPVVWERLEKYEDDFLPDYWKNASQEAIEAGHGGGDYFEVDEFIRAVLGEKANPIDVHRAMDMTLPGLISQESIRMGGIWLDVPDSRKW